MGKKEQVFQKMKERGYLCHNGDGYYWYVHFSCMINPNFNTPVEAIVSSLRYMGGKRDEISGNKKRKNETDSERARILDYHRSVHWDGQT